MKKLFILLAVASLGFVACNNEEKTEEAPATDTPAVETPAPDTTTIITPADTTTVVTPDTTAAK